MTSSDSLAHRLADVLGDAIRLPSVNPAHCGERVDCCGEQAMADWIAERAGALGGSVVLDEVEPGRPNVYATFAGASDTTLAIDVHLDTVGVDHMTRDPFDGALEDGRVYGRGACDTKATFAVVLCVIEDLLASGEGLACNVQLVGTVGEEVLGMVGAARYRDWLSATETSVDQVIVAEPTECVPVYGHKGGFDLMVDIKGQAAHSADVALGVNAVSAAARAVIAVDVEHDRLEAEGGATEVGSGSVAATLIDGFTGTNIIPDRCSLRVHRRVAPGEEPLEVVDQLSRLIRSAARPAEADVELVNGLAVSSFYRSPKSRLVSTLCDLTGNQPGVASFGTNAMVHGDIAPEMVIFGPGSIAQAHQPEEWIEVGELVRAYGIYRALLGANARPSGQS